MTDIDTKIYSNHEYYRSLYPGIVVNEINGSVKVYSSVEEEYDTLVNGAAMRDISFWGLIQLTGKDTIDFLHRISTNKILGLPSYSAVNTIFTNEKGRIIDRALLLNLEYIQLLISSCQFRNKLLTWINKYIIAEDIKTSLVNSKYSVFEIMGSQSDSFLTLIFGKEIDSVKLNEIKKVNIERAEYYCVKIDDCGIIKYLLISNSEDTSFLLRYMHENRSVFDFRMTGEDAYDVLRVEKGVPAAPNELNDLYNPHESKIINEVSFSKGCYIGQEVIARLETYDKVQRELFKVTLDRMPEGEDLTILHNSNEAGKITSLVYSPGMKEPVGLAYVKKEFAVNGNQFIARDKSGREYKATLKAIPVKK